MSGPAPEVKSVWRLIVLALGFFFLYMPIIVLIVYSFNDSQLVTVWSKFSLRWYKELFVGVQQQSEAIRSGVLLSLTIGFFSASFAVVLGTISAFVLTRFDSFRTKTLFSFLTTAPMVLPDVIIGLALMLLFVALENMTGGLYDWLNGMKVEEGTLWSGIHSALTYCASKIAGWPEKGAFTIWRAMVTLTSAYVSVVVRTRLQEMDNSIEEAAMDLGATPLKTFFVITIPSLFPAILSGWLLAFTISMDDVVITQFVSGPGAKTLPIVVFSSVRRGVSPTINALASIIVLVVSVCTFIVWYTMHRKDKKRQREYGMMSVRQKAEREKSDTPKA